MYVDKKMISLTKKTHYYLYAEPTQRSPISPTSRQKLYTTGQQTKA